MPEIRVQHVVSCSSEDKNNPADNLLKPEGTHKWKCSTAGEKNVSVVLQFEKASQIQSIDIGNEGSAFVEVLVGKSTSSDQDYQVLLVASTFMTPLEARNGTNRNSVRMFGPDKLSATAVKEKWDRVKVVCTQPFNKTSTFGLSFIKFHSTPSPTDKDQTKCEEKKLGFFKLKNEENGDVKTGTLFAHRDKPPDPKPVTGAAAIRAASRLAEESKPKAEPSSTHTTSTDSPKPSTSSSTASAKSIEAANLSGDKVEKKQGRANDIKAEKQTVSSPKQNREKRKHQVSDDEDTEEEEMIKPPLRKQSTSLSSTASKAEKPPPIKKTKSEPPKESQVREFSKLLDKVVFVLSGFQNPYRGELRDKALSMGATYKPDWGKGCTHLICAFVNTPKYNQVNGKGRIVNQKWISDCYKQGKLLPWRKYRLGDAESPDEDSEEEIIPHKATTPKSKPAEKPQKKAQTTPQKANYDSDDDMYGGDTDSGEDTEDEIRRIKEGKAKMKSPVKQTSPKKGTDPEDDPYGAETDEDEQGTSKMEMDDGNDSGLPELPDFFTDKVFFFYGEMSASDRRLLTRYITAYNGEIEDYMNDKVKYVVTFAKWDDNFDDALSGNPNLVFVKPKWVFMCHEKTKCLPHQPYVVVPDS